MIAITPTVLDWYRQRIAPPLAIFKDAEAKQRRISIHEIINLNAGLITHNAASVPGDRETDRQVLDKGQ